MISSRPGERAGDDEQHVGGVDLDELLVRMLAAALRRNRRDRALEDLEQGLLHALARHVARDRRVLGLAGDLVDLVDVDDAGLGALDVVVGGLDELQEDVLDIFTDVAGLGERRRIRHRERHVEALGEGLGEVGLAAAGRADEQDVGLGDLDIVDDVGRAERVAGADALVVVVDGHREGDLRRLLADDVLLEEREDLLRLREVEFARGLFARFGETFLDDLVAQFDALVADVDAGTGDELLHLLLAFAAEGTLEQIGALPNAGHSRSPLAMIVSRNYVGSSLTRGGDTASNRQEL